MKRWIRGLLGAPVLGKEKTKIQETKKPPKKRKGLRKAQLTKEELVSLNVIMERAELDALKRVTGPDTLVLFSMELRTPPVLQGLLAALLAEGFIVARVPRSASDGGGDGGDDDNDGDRKNHNKKQEVSFLHPDYSSPSVIVYALRRGPRAEALARLSVFDFRSNGDGDGGGDEHEQPAMCPFFAGIMQLTPARA